MLDTEITVISALLQICGNGEEESIDIEIREGRWIVDGVASVDSWRNARELLEDVA